MHRRGVRDRRDRRPYQGRSSLSSGSGNTGAGCAGICGNSLLQAAEAGLQLVATELSEERKGAQAQPFEQVAAGAGRRLANRGEARDAPAGRRERRYDLVQCRGVAYGKSGMARVIDRGFDAKLGIVRVRMGEGLSVRSRVAFFQCEAT